MSKIRSDVHGLTQRTALVALSLILGATMMGGATIGLTAAPIKMQLGPLMYGYVNNSERAKGQSIYPFGCGFVPVSDVACQILAAAVEATKSFDHTKLGDYVRNNTVSTVFSEIKFGTNSEWVKPAVDAGSVSKSDLRITWSGMFLPGGTPASTVAALSAQLEKLTKDPEVIDAQAKLGNETTFMQPNAFARLIKADVEKWASIVKMSGFVPGQ